MATETTEQTAVEETAAPAAETPAPVQEVQWEKPDPKKHVYNSIAPYTGYTVSVNTDRKTWTSKGPNGDLGTDYPNRQTAYDAVDDVVFPDRKKAAASAGNKAVKQQINVREHLVLNTIVESPETIDMDAIAEKSKLDVGIVMGVLSNLMRRKFITLTKEGPQITETGRAAHSTFVAPEKGARTVNPNKVKSDFDRQAAMEAKYGPRPEGIGPRPSMEEYYESVLTNAQAALAHAIVIQRLHAYSPAVAKRVQNAKDRVANAEINLQAIKEGKPLPKPEKEAAESPEGDTEVAETPAE